MHHRTLTTTRSVLVITLVVLFLAALIGGMGAHVVSTMRRSADAMDDARAVKAAQAALLAMKHRLGSTVRDNAVWDEAYEAIAGGGVAEWTYANWGKTSEDYPLYDAVALSSSGGENLSSFWKGEPFNPGERLGHLFLEQTRLAASDIKNPVINFFRDNDDVVLVASQAVQPYTSKGAEKSYNILSFLKVVTPGVASFIAKEYQLNGLQLNPNHQPTLLNLPLNDLHGSAIAVFSWPSMEPGSQVFQSVRYYVLGCVVLVGTLIACVMAAGAAEARRLSKLAMASQWQATHDSLSGLYNRLGLIGKLQCLLPARGHRQRLVLHLLDLDGFKPVNDAWGHAVGDQLLVLVAKALLDGHPEVSCVARIGGDEFAFVQLGRTDPREVAQAVLEIFRAPFMIGGRTIEIGATMGAAEEEDVLDPHELLRRADIALYEGKEGGRARFVPYSSELDRERERLAALESELRRAIQRDEIYPLFQPVANAATGKVEGVEALARWRRGDEEVRPDVFIPLAEKAGLIDMLGLKMLRSSVNAAKDWPDLAISVNVSPIQLCNPSFASDVLSLLATEAFDPRRLVLEITEAVLISNPDQAKRAIDSLKASGIRLALDDFGCGYASIGALREFGFDRMKIDRSLILAIDQEGSGVDVLRATISLAAALGIPVTAEGIETGRQAEVLRDAGCDQLQGYLVGRPMTKQDVSATIACAAKAA